MKKKNEIRTKKCLTAIGLAVLSFSLLTGCGNKKVDDVNVTDTEVVEIEVATTEVVEDATEVVTPFLSDLEKYDSIISTLTPNQYYAFAGIGEDYDALLVADGVFDNGDGTMAAIEAKVYGFGNDGVLYEAGSVWSDGTAYPIAAYENSIMFGGNHRMVMACVKDGSIVIEKEAYEEFDEQGNATYFYDEGDIDNIKELEDDSALADMFKQYDSAIAINFTPGEAEIIGDAELIEDYPSNEFEDRVGKISFESYDEIIGLLDKGEGYAYAKVKGYDGDALLITSYVFDDQLGHMATTECSIYTKKPNGTVDYDSVLMAGGTATPITIDADGVLYETSHLSVAKQCYGENSTGNTVFMVLASVSTDEVDDNGEPASIYGINRKINSLVDEDNDVDIASDDVAFYHKMFEDYEKSEVVNFTVVE